MYELTPEATDFLETRTADELLVWVGHLAGKHFVQRALQAQGISNAQVNAAVELADDQAVLEYSRATERLQSLLEIREKHPPL